MNIPLAVRLAVSISLLMALAVLGSGCGRRAKIEPALPPWFVEVTKESGIDFAHDAGPRPGDNYFMPQIMGSGCALFDSDGDGRLDVYLVHNGGPKGKKNQLFRQGSDGTFTDRSAGSGLDVAGHGMGATVGDINNDGLPDVLVTGFGGARLFLNQGKGKFLDITERAGIRGSLWGTAAAFFDYDRDGWLDLVIVHYLEYDPAKRCGGAAREPDYCHPDNFPGTITRLYRNVGGKDARFEDVTVAAGLARTPGPGLGVLCGDFNADGWPDIFVANDARANRLWINQKNGTFTDEAVLRGVAYNGWGQPQANMGVAWGDTTGEGRFDFFVTHLGSELHALWRQELPGQFRDRTAEAGLARPGGTGFATAFADFDHDGAIDLAIVNGRVNRKDLASRADRADFWRAYAERNQLFVNDGKGRFRDDSARQAPFCGRAEVSRGLAVGDLDGDGALDLVTTGVAGPARVYRNVTPDRGHWLMARVVDPALGGRDAYGALVTVRAGGRSQTRLVNPSTGYLCSDDPRAHFGLGAAERVESIEVLWPDGARESFPGSPVDRQLTLRKGEGRRKE